MRFDDLYIAGHGVWLPGTVPVAEAVAAGRYPGSEARRSRLLSATVAGEGEEESPPGMAARAAARALAVSGHTADEVDLLLHAAVHYQGHDLWAPASYIQREVLGGHCLALEVRQMSNGGMASLELAARCLASGAHGRAALLTAGDRFHLPGFDRWRSDPGTVYADGGAALVVSRRGGYARLLSVASYADAELEGMHRGDDPFATGPHAVRPTVDLQACKKDFVRRFGMAAGIARVGAGRRAAVEQALSDAGTGLERIDWFVLPHLGRRRLEVAWFRPLGITPERTTWEWSRTVGHLGAADQYASLGHLVDTGRARPGQQVLLLGVGAGFSWSAAVLELLDPRADSTGQGPAGPARALPEPEGGAR